MGCNNCRGYYKESELVFSLIDKRKKIKLLENKNYEMLVDSREKLLKQKEFYDDINNEYKLTNYLDSIKDDKKVYDYELLLYFDALSIQNKSKYCRSNNFISCIDIYQKLIDFLCELKFDKIKESKYYINYLSISGRDELINSNDFSLKR